MTKSFWINLMRKVFAGLMGVALLSLLAACGGGGSGGTSPQTPLGSLTVSPSNVVMEPGAPPVELIIAGGVKPYTISSSQPNLISVPGIISGDQDGRFHIQPAFVPDNNALVTITVRDALQNVVTASVTVNANPVVPPPPLTVSPTAADAGIGVPITYTISGGVGPYTVTSSQPTIVPNPIAVDAQGRFTVTPITNPSVNTTVTLTVRDSKLTTVIATLNVRALALALSPSSATTTAGVPVTFQLSGGNGPYSVTSSSPSLIPNPTVDVNGRFTITPLANVSTATTVTLTARDANGTQVIGTVTLTPIPLSVSPTEIVVPANTPATFTITGGTAPYTVTSSRPDLVPSPTSVDAQGRFTLVATTVPTTATEVLITIRDAANTVVTVKMTVLPAPVSTPQPLAVLPSTITVYANQPGSVTIFGGKPPYQAFSSNPQVLPIAQNVVGDRILLAPNNVAADTNVTVTVVDATGATATVTVTVKPAALLNTLTVTPTPASPGTGCVPAVCSGQTASVTVTVRDVAGAAIAGRSVRFENVQGNYQFYTSGPGMPDTFANSITVTTDQNGQAIVRIKADVNAPTQVALIRATELTSGNVLNSSFTIAQFTDGGGTLTATPTTWSMSGPNSSTCAANVPVTYYIFGGTPPYRIQSTLPNFAVITPSIVQTNGGGFTATVTGLVCTSAEGASITITDATGRTISVTLINTVGTGVTTTNFEAIQVVPGNITSPAVTCGQSITQQIVGGNFRQSDGSVVTPNFVVSSTSPYVTVTVSGRLITIARNTTIIPPAELPASAVIRVSNGLSLESFSVAIGNSAACTVAGGGGGGSAAITFGSQPLGIGCAVGASAITSIVGGTAPYTATPDAGLTATVVGNTITVTRTAAVLAGSSSIGVNVSSSGAVGTLLVAPAGPGC